MWAEVNGERKKVACGPCIRGHRSSKCDHRDRVLVEVRKPGRPLSSCPHPSGSCSCERVVINYTIPKSSECACPSERAQPAATVTGNSRIQKNRRKSTAVNSASLERAIRAGQDAETDTSSSVTRAPTERSGSNGGSPLSSASSTPRLLPAQNDKISSCCQPKPVASPVKQSSCCSNKVEASTESVPVKSCCSSKTQPNTQNQASAFSQLGQHFQFPIQSQIQMPQYQPFQPHTSSPAQFPFGLGAPIYNHAAAAYQQQQIASMSPVVGGSMASHIAGLRVNQHVPEHNCHCGDSCSCFGCAAHPNNATMMEYIRLMAEFQYSGNFGAMSPPLYDMPTYPHHPGFGTETNQSMNFNNIPQAMSTATPTQMSFNANLNMSLLSQTPVSAVQSWQQNNLSTSTDQNAQLMEPSNYGIPDRIDTRVPVKAEELVATPVSDSPADSKDEDTPTLSPSTFFWNEMVMPGCDDATGTCQCGDGCACVGCLTHGGHNGVQLEAPALDDHEAFPEFSGESASLTLDDPSHFLTFHKTTT
ncbi:hypothetical protein ACN47E_002551 [Coniothyrium glycines]